MMKKIKLSRLLPVFGIILFIYILSRVNINLVVQTFLNMNVYFLLVAFALTLPSLFVKTEKWRQLINPFKVRLGWKEGFTAWLAAFFIGLITPGRVGDLARALYLKEIMETGKALTTVVVDRILDVFVLMTLSAFGLAFIFSHFAVHSRAPVFIAVMYLLFIALVAFALREKWAEKLFHPIYNYVVPQNHKERFRAGFRDFYKGIKVLLNHKTAVIKATLLSFFAWWIVSLQYYLLARAMGVEINYFLLFMIFPTVLLVEILPISLSGLGTRDATLILFFSFVGLAASTAVALSLSILMFSYIYSLAGLAIWIKKPIKL